MCVCVVGGGGGGVLYIFRMFTKFIADIQGNKNYNHRMIVCLLCSLDIIPVMKKTCLVRKSTEVLTSKHFLICVHIDRCVVL